MSGIATAVIGGAVIGAYASNQAAKKAASGAESAARIGASATDRATELQRQIYEESRPYLEKLREAGIYGIEGYQGLLESPEQYKKAPGYLFRLEEGLKSIGIPDGGSRNLSGPQIKAAIKYAEDYATSEYDRTLARYGNLIGVGTGAVSAGQQYAATAGGLLTQGAAISAQGTQNAANARASGYLGVGSAISQGVQNYALYNMWKQNQQPTAAAA